MNYTKSVQINQLLENLVAAIKAILGDNLLGLYVYGSLVWGEFDDDISDIDLLAVTQNHIDQNAFSKLKEMHQDLSKHFQKWDDRIEVAYIAKSALSTFKTVRSPIVVISPGEPLNIKDAGTDWLINWYLIQEKNRVLFGPDPRQFIATITKEEYVAAVKTQANEWRDWVAYTKDSRSFQAYAILTLCRALYTVKNGEHASKQQAALWGQKKYPHWAPIIQNATQWRKDYKNKQIDPALTYSEVVKTVHDMIVEINK